jgi:hypothetical protein
VNHPGKIFCLAALGASLVAGCGGDKNATPPATAQNPQNNAAVQPGQPGYQQQPGGYQQQPGGYQQQPGGYQQQPGGYQQQPGAQPGYQPQAQPGAQPGYQPQQQPGAQPGYQPQQQQQPAQQQPGAQQPGAIPGLPGMPAAPAAGSGGGTAQALDPNVAMVATTALATIANTAAPGMARDGNTVAGNFTPGQSLPPVTFTIQPGKCYTIVAAGVGPGMQVDITAAAQPPVAIPGFNPQFGQAQGKPSATGSQAVLGGGANCVKLALSPMAVPATYTITVSKGSGMVAAQLYSK